MKNLDNTYLINDTVYSKGRASCGYSFVKYFLKKNNDIKTFLDIGCGNGILLDLMNNKMKYLGVDADAGVYKRKKNKNIKYFYDGKKTENFLIKKDKNKYDCVVCMDVLEHTDTFLGLFSIALKKSNKYVLIGLPNEDYIISRLRFLFGGGILTHGLEMISAKPGHKHQWFIQYKTALLLLKNYAKKNNFILKKKYFFVDQPRTLWKRILYKTILICLPKHLQMNDFCLVFKKKTLRRI